MALDKVITEARCGRAHKKGKSMFFKKHQVSLSDVKGDVDKLVDDVRSLLSVKELDAIPEIKRIRERMDEGMGIAKDSAARAIAQTKHTAACTDKYAHDEPWRFAGAALAIGVVLGYAVCRR